MVATKEIIIVEDTGDTKMPALKSGPPKPPPSTDKYY
jgi:hypothetical protein